MSLLNTLEDFGAFTGTTVNGPELSEDERETQRLDIFEQGYRAGWDDAIKAQSDDQSRITSDFAQNLQDLSFTYHEAHAQIVNAMQPLMTQIVDSLLPEMARQSLGQQIVGELRNLARSQALPQVEIVVAPANKAALEPWLDQEFSFPIALRDDAMMGEGQAEIRFAEAERQIDLTGVVDGIATAMRGFFNENKKELRHG